MQNSNFGILVWAITCSRDQIAWNLCIECFGEYAYTNPFMKNPPIMHYGSMNVSSLMKKSHSTSSNSNHRTIYIVLLGGTKSIIHFAQQLFVWINGITNIFAVNVGFASSIISLPSIIWRWLVATKFNSKFKHTSITFFLNINYWYPAASENCY